MLYSFEDFATRYMKELGYMEPQKLLSTKYKNISDVGKSINSELARNNKERARRGYKYDPAVTQKYERALSRRSYVRRPLSTSDIKKAQKGYSVPFSEDLNENR